MSLDPVRASIVRRMVSQEAMATWSLKHLPMKKIKGGCVDAFGIINQPIATNRIVVIEDKTGEQHLFTSVEELISAGWAVD